MSIMQVTQGNSNTGEDQNKNNTRIKKEYSNKIIVRVLGGVAYLYSNNPIEYILVDEDNKPVIEQSYYDPKYTEGIYNELKNS